MNLKSTLIGVAFIAFGTPLFGQNNTYSGTDSGGGTSAGIENAGFGYQAADLMAVGGNYNSFFGARSGLFTTTGDGNSFFGYRAGNSNATGSYNVFLGYHAGYN